MFALITATILFIITANVFAIQLGTAHGLESKEKSRLVLKSAGVFVLGILIGILYCLGIKF